MLGKGPACMARPYSRDLREGVVPGVDHRPGASDNPSDPPQDEAARRGRAVIGHVKAEHRLGRNYLKGRDGDRSNAVLAAAGYNFSLLVRWLARLLRALIRALLPAPLAAQIG